MILNTYSLGLLLRHTQEILHGVDLFLNKDFIYSNRRGGRQEAFPFFSRVFLSTCLVNVIFTTFPTFVSVSFSSDGTKLLGSEGTYFQLSEQCWKLSLEEKKKSWALIKIKFVFLLPNQQSALLPWSLVLGIYCTSEHSNLLDYSLCGINLILVIWVIFSHFRMTEWKLVFSGYLEYQAIFFFFPWKRINIFERPSIGEIRLEKRHWEIRIRPPCLLLAHMGTSSWAS